MKRVYVKLIGGLGNQLFQLASAIAIAEGKIENIYIDDSAYKKYKLRRSRVEMLQISQEGPLKRYTPNLNAKIAEKIFRAGQKIIRLIRRRKTAGRLFSTSFGHFGRFYNFDPVYYPFPNTRGLLNISIYGYFQSEKYFAKHREEVRRLLVPSEKLLNRAALKRYIETIDSATDIALSIRCGNDYKKCGLFMCDQLYFNKALREMSGRLPKSGKLFIFTDDVEEMRRTFSFTEQVVVVDDLDEFESLLLLTEFKNLIISNSSFSWWGAYLSRHERPVIIAPKNWFNSKCEYNDIYCNNWILL